MKKIFISWSGKLSNEIANILKWWIPKVFVVKNEPFVSSQDIEKGTNWANKLSDELIDSEFGIVCVTKSNLDSLWVHFEAGAISKQTKDSSKVCPFLFNVEYAKLNKGPLSQFQATIFEKQDVFKLIESLNKSCMDTPLDPAGLKSQFEMWWPKLEEKLKELEKSFPDIDENISSDNDKKILSLIETQNESLKEITEKINKIGIDYPNLLNTFMDETGVTYRSSIFGTRINHFSNEKKALARKTIDILQEELKENKGMKFCLLIDSGTTTYDLFCEISYRIKEASGDNKSEENDTVYDIWKNRIFIITNNLPGIQYLMKNCRMGTDDYSDLFIKCLLLPGKPLPVYAAVAGSETIGFLKKDKISKLIEKELNVKKREEYRIICLMSGNYIVRHHDRIKERELFCPVARGGEEGGHFDIKDAFAVLSDKIYLISPLTKISFATCECLNKINGYTINENAVKEAEDARTSPDKIKNAVKETEDARTSPDKVKYREIELITDEFVEKCSFVLTIRRSPDIFRIFSQDLLTEIEKSYGSSNIHIADYDIKEVIRNVSDNTNKYTDLELEIEIPHGNLRNAYLNNKKKHDDQFIWSHSWMSKTTDKCGNDPK